MKSGKLSGFVLPDPQVCLPGSALHSPLLAHGCPDIEGIASITFVFAVNEIHFVARGIFILILPVPTINTSRSC